MFFVRVEMSDRTPLMPDCCLFCQQFRSAISDRELLWDFCKQRRIPQISGLFCVLRSAGAAFVVIANLSSFIGSTVEQADQVGIFLTQKSGTKISPFGLIFLTSESFCSMMMACWTLKKRHDIEGNAGTQLLPLCKALLLPIICLGFSASENHRFFPLFRFHEVRRSGNWSGGLIAHGHAGPV